MPDPVAQPTPATPDELAALYLRARDVPCPNCNYNRRDGTTATCPECSHHGVLALQPSQRSPMSTAVLMICASLFVGVMVGWNNIQQWKEVISGGYFAPDLYAQLSARTLMALLLFGSASTATLLFRRRSREGDRSRSLLMVSIWLHVLAYPVVVIAHLIT